MSSRARKPIFGLPWLAALVLASCAVDAPRLSQESAPDTFYEGLNAEAAAVARQAVQEALETRRSADTLVWTYGNGSSGSVTPLRTFRIKTGHYCRDFAETIASGSQPISANRTACRDGEGKWRVVKR